LGVAKFFKLFLCGKGLFLKFFFGSDSESIISSLVTSHFAAHYDYAVIPRRPLRDHFLTFTSIFQTLPYSNSPMKFRLYFIPKKLLEIQLEPRDLFFRKLTYSNFFIAYTIDLSRRSERLKVMKNCIEVTMSRNDASPFFISSKILIIRHPF
jgi:hypothetical protein